MVERPRERRSMERWHQRRSLALAVAARNVILPDRDPDRLPPGWTVSDLAWERCQEQAASAYLDGDRTAPLALWLRALEIGDQWFTRGDPRLAASLTNQAVSLRRQHFVFQAQKLFQEALEVWDEGWRWVCLMRPPDDGSGEGTYDRAARAEFLELIERGRAASAALANYDPVPEPTLGLWFEHRPRRLSDVRKLLAGVLLIVPDPL